ncbi:Oidioi.mRNA.OKI2018_I69.chr1.g1883.t1.cds [Oikopleura dioica]|uniref:Oidioi.mRNA.OKI2018_I69.chr1.g1883.t1.cds n=1 Tax=Oikopleura dioica TaxID=34765 RepID=A0ABN7SQZ6_OIKDI|nr:Oidioi.mRNA.OKI2018_I69.chr1.g1883.t1.cds [Oikopleura dioica]
MILSELILKRMPMDALAWLAPNVLEDVNEEGDCRFDDLAGFDFCQTFLNRHYKRDSILELVGKEFEAEKKSKPDRLSDVMKIVQKRHDLKYNKKKLEPKATIEFKRSKLDVRFSSSYLFTGQYFKPQGLDLRAARGNLLLFKINRNNEECLPKLDLVDYRPGDEHHFPRRRPFTPLYRSAFNPCTDGVFLDDVVLGKPHQERLFRVSSVTTDVLKDRRVMSDNMGGLDGRFKRMEFNFSRQRAWRDYVSNPEESLHPMIRCNRTGPVRANSPEAIEMERQAEEEEKNPFQKTVIDFYRFSGDNEEVAWSFDFTLPKDKQYYEFNMEARFIDQCHWLITARSSLKRSLVEEDDDDEDEENDEDSPDFSQPPNLVYHCDLKSKEATLYSFPEDEDLFNEDLFNRNFGVFKEKSRKRRLDTEESDDPLNNDLCFFEYPKLKDLKFTPELIRHVGEPYEGTVEIYTFTIDNIKEKILSSEKRSKINKDGTQEKTLPVVCLEDFRIPKYQDSRENLLPWQSDIGYVEGKKFHLLV